MQRKSDILAKINQQFDRQAEVLRGRLTEAEIAEYVMRRYQIESLIELLPFASPTTRVKTAKGNY